MTISVLIATGKPAQLARHLARALDNGVQPREASGILAHQAIYSGWPNAVSALDVCDQVYAGRKVDPATLRETAPRLAASASDASRAAENEQLATIAPKFVLLTNGVVIDAARAQRISAERLRRAPSAPNNLLERKAEYTDDESLDPRLACLDGDAIIRHRKKASRACCRNAGHHKGATGGYQSL